MGATRGATDAFSGVSRHVTDAVSRITFSFSVLDSREYSVSWYEIGRENHYTSVEGFPNVLFCFLIVQLRKVGAKNIEAGIGCGVGFGHGFGVGMSSYLLLGESVL